LATSLLKKKGDGLAFEWWRSVWEKVKRVWRKNRFFGYGYGAWQEFHLAPTYLQVRWRNQSYVVLASKKMFLCFWSRLATSLLKKGKGDGLTFEWWRSVWEKS